MQNEYDIKFVVLWLLVRFTPFLRKMPFCTGKIANLSVFKMLYNAKKFVHYAYMYLHMYMSSKTSGNGHNVTALQRHK